MDFDIIRSLVKIVELKDESTIAHTWRVALYTQALAEAAGLVPDQVHRVMHGAVLHDIGKIDIPYEILAKPGPLTDVEFELIRTHTVIGYDRLKRMGVEDEVVLALVRSHHERLDGSGYPDGLAGEDIPAAARVFAVIDTFDAMTSIRPYRPEVGSGAARVAIDELKDKAGTWYCPESVNRFAELFESGALGWILEHFNDPESLEGLVAGLDPEVVEERRRLLKSVIDKSALPET